MVIGSGPIIIGQAAEFDYSGTQACLALREEGYEVVLVNSNPATIMTDTTIADKVYIEPLTVESISRIIRQEYPDAILPTLGGQVGLNMALALAKTGILDELHIELLGTKLDSIEQAEDREKFKKLCKSWANLCHHPRRLIQLKMLWPLVMKSAIQSSYVLPSQWVVPVVVSATTVKN